MKKPYQKQTKHIYSLIFNKLSNITHVFPTNKHVKKNNTYEKLFSALCGKKLHTELSF